jgi:hypothetical protein
MVTSIPAAWQLFVNSRVVEITSRVVRDLSDRRRAEGVQRVSCYNQL